MFNKIYIYCEMTDNDELILVIIKEKIINLTNLKHSCY
jgi:hypothetical protein